MAVAIAEGAKAEGAEVILLSVDKATKKDVLNSDAVALGCPSMGAEVLEEEEVEPFVTEIEKEKLEGKPLALFDSSDWGDGEWMCDWEDRMEKTDVKRIEEGLKIQNTPDEAGLKMCRELGKKLASV
jgi:flavodoxin short chain